MNFGGTICFFCGEIGLDLAYIRNGYVYHTKYDTVAHVTQESLQRAGDNLLGLVRFHFPTRSNPLQPNSETFSS